MLAAGWELSCTDTGLTEELRPTPSCHDGDEPTIRQTEGPFFKPRSPERSDLREPDTKGSRFELSGFGRIELKPKERAIGLDRTE
jgi:hypothetical protein